MTINEIIEDCYKQIGEIESEISSLDEMNLRRYVLQGKIEGINWVLNLIFILEREMNEEIVKLHNTKNIYAHLLHQFLNQFIGKVEVAESKKNIKEKKL